MKHEEQLLQKIKAKQLKVGIIGLGYVGLPLALRFSEEGFVVVGFDIDPEKVELLKKGESYIEHIPTESIRMLIQRGFQATTDFSRARDVDALDRIHLDGDGELHGVCAFS